MNTANKITITRILLIPVFVICFYIWEISNPVSAIVFIIAASTDFLDGYIARSRNQVTTFGKFLDPLVDKMLTQSAFIILTAFGYIPAWVVIVIVCREFIITGFRTLAASENITIAASALGKFKTVTQFLAISAYLLSATLLSGINFPIPEILLYTALIFTVLSGVDYVIKNIKVLKLENI